MISASTRSVVACLHQPITKEILMAQPLFLRLSLSFATLACLACLPAAASAVEIRDDDVFDFKGTVTDVGVQRGPGQIGGIEYRIEGKFDYNGPLDLSKSTITFHNLFDESEKGGNGEMVLTTDNAPLVCPDPPDGCVLVKPGEVSLPTLVSASSSKKIEAKYETFRFRPPMRVQIKNKNGEYQFNVRLDRGTSPQVCLKNVEPCDAHLLPADRQFPKLCGVDPADKSKRVKTDIRTSFTISDGVHEPVVLDFVKAWECSQPGRYHLRAR
jgi:hypothetical protein